MRYQAFSNFKLIVQIYGYVFFIGIITDDVEIIQKKNRQVYSLHEVNCWKIH